MMVTEQSEANTLVIRLGNRRKDDVIISFFEKLIVGAILTYLDGKPIQVLC